MKRKSKARAKRGVKPKSRGPVFGKARRLAASVNVARALNRTGAEAFEACVVFGKRGVQPLYCAVGKNPRAALAKALRASATGMSGRKGAFAGKGR